MFLPGEAMSAKVELVIAELLNTLTKAEVEEVGNRLVRHIVYTGTPLAKPLAFGWVERDEPEWEAIWSMFPDKHMLDVASGEWLEYMGSTQTTEGWQHEFRHRCEPTTQRRQYWQIPASAGWQPRTRKEDV
jgi:hypothetical protein